MKSDEYSRKISVKEGEKGFIFILKNKLSFFPPQGKIFKMVKDGSSKEVKVESYPCTCRGPDLPHEHYFITWEEISAGDTVKIVKDWDKYILKIE